MSSEAEHIALANRFQVSIVHLSTNPDDCCEMIAIAASYKAMHVVEAMFYHDPAIEHCRSHKDRLDALGVNYRRYAAVYRNLKALWGASEVARSLLHRDHANAGLRPRTPIAYSNFSDYIAPDRLKPDLLDRYLIPIEAFAISNNSPHSGEIALLSRFV